MAVESEPAPPTVAHFTEPFPAGVAGTSAEAGIDPAEQRRRRRDEPFRVHMPVDVRSISLTIIAAGVVVATLHLAQEVIIPFVVSGLLFYALDPIVDWMQRWKLPRAIGAALVLLVALGGVGGGAYAISG